MTLWKFVCAGSLSLALLSMWAPAAAADEKTDQKIATAVERTIQNYPYYTIYDHVTGAVSGNVVTLTGKVTIAQKASEIADRVSNLSGVQKVVNQIQTLPLSPFDDQLRIRIAMKIFRNPLFLNYAMQGEPTIHILVEHGHATLTGVVATELERTEAGAAASQTPGVLSVDNRLQLDSEVPSIK